MTNEKRLTDEELEAMRQQVLTSTRGHGLVDNVRGSDLLYAVAELRRKRALLGELVEEEGCPWREVDGKLVCALCGGPAHKSRGPRSEPTYDHTASCLWPRLEREVKG